MNEQLPGKLTLEARELIGAWEGDPAWLPFSESLFTTLAMRIFRAQFEFVPPYRSLCLARGRTAATIGGWEAIPAVPTSAFKEFDFTSLAPAARTTVFHSSGTTAQAPSRHFHGDGSLALYETSLRAWFRPHGLPASPPLSRGDSRCPFLLLTPPASEAPHSSLAHMFTHLAGVFGEPDAEFLAQADPTDGWRLDFERCRRALATATGQGRPVVLMGTAFSFVHLIDRLAREGERVVLPAGSRVLETGGYKGRSRTLSRSELHEAIATHLGVPEDHIVCEYGMSELSSQAYALHAPRGPRVFRFPPWAKARVISPETGQEVAEGGTGLLQVFDLANVRSVMAIQTEDLAVRRGVGFELVGRAAQVEPRGCSWLAVAR